MFIASVITVVVALVTQILEDAQAAAALLEVHDELQYGCSVMYIKSITVIRIFT